MMNQCDVDTEQKLTILPGAIVTPHVSIVKYGVEQYTEFIKIIFFFTPFTLLRLYTILQHR